MADQYMPSSNTFNHTLQKTAKKWQRALTAVHETKTSLDTYAHNTGRGLTNAKIGPPTWLDSTAKATWLHQLQITLRNCIGCILIPAQDKRLRRIWQDLLTTMKHCENGEQIHSMGLALARGLNRGLTPWDTKVVFTNQHKQKRIQYRTDTVTSTNIDSNETHRASDAIQPLFPPPPPPFLPPPPLFLPPPPPLPQNPSDTNTLHTEATRQPEDIPPFRQLLRGEDFTPLSNHFEVNWAFTPTRDLAKPLAHGIFGSSKRAPFIYRSVYKYLLWYEDVIREDFKPTTVMSIKGGDCLVKTWEEWKETVRRRKCFLTRDLITIVATLYQVQIRFFTHKVGEGKRVQFVCTGQTKYLHHRVINILQTTGNRWTPLQGTTLPVLIYNTQLGKFDVDYYLADHPYTIDNTCTSTHTHTGNHTAHRHSQTAGEIQRVDRQNDYTEGVEKQIETHANTHTDIKPQDNHSTTPNNTHATSPLVQAETTCRQDVPTDTDTMLRTLFPTELYIDKPQKTHVSKRQVWQRWRNIIRNKNKQAYKKYLATVAKEKRRKESQKLVFDYTTGGLTESEMDILSMGETFCPTSHNLDMDRLKTDIYHYNRRLRLHEQFRDKHPTQADDSHAEETQTIQLAGHTRTSVRESINRINRRTSTSTPTQNDTNNIKHRHLPSTYDPLTQNRNLNRYTCCIQEECLLVTNTEVKVKDNIHKQHRAALKTLQNKIDSRQIMITKADKGSGIVACDYDLYIQKGTKYIEEEARAYVKVEQAEIDILHKLVKRRNKIVEQLKKENVIPLHTATFCTKQIEEKITGMKFYFKIHKDQNITTTPVRPLQSCISAPTHHLSLVLTDILQPLLTTNHIPSFIYDSNHLLFRLQTLGCIPNNCTIVSSDVSALYPSIPHLQGLQSIQQFLTTNTKYTNTQITTLTQALELVISENFVMWNNNIYKQTSGVAMGTPVAVAYANIFMAWVDEKVRQRANYIHEHIRFIDDNLFIIPEDKINTLMQIANDILPGIKYTHDKLNRNSNKGLAFLDTQLFISEDNHIEARLYTKPTDRHAYLLPTSYHPPHIVKNIPSSVFKRLRRICSRQEWFVQDAEQAKGWLVSRGYEAKEVNKAFEKANKMNRWDMILKIEKNRGVKKDTEGGTYNIPFIMTYSKYAKGLKQAIRRRQNLLDNSYRYIKVKPRITFRRQKNLDDLLIQKALRGPIRQENNEMKGFTRCGEIQQYRGECPCRIVHEKGLCRCCAHAFFEPAHVNVKLHKKVTCATKNVVYLIGCRKCTKQYVGETQQTLRDRLAQHMSNIHKFNQPLYLHFRQIHQPTNLYITILETVRSTDQFFRKVREAWWINHLQTLEPRGLNVKLDCNQTYQEDNRQVQQALPNPSRS